MRKHSMENKQGVNYDKFNRKKRDKKIQRI